MPAASVATSALLLLCVAAPASTALLVRPPPLPKPWRSEAADAGATVTFSVALTERNGAELERLALAVSEPSSPSYGRHLTASQIDALTAPAPEHTAAVTARADNSSGPRGRLTGPLRTPSRTPSILCR